MKNMKTKIAVIVLTLTCSGFTIANDVTQDYCKNIAGIQGGIPDNYIVNQGKCFKKSIRDIIVRSQEIKEKFKERFEISRQNTQNINESSYDTVNNDEKPVNQNQSTKLTFKEKMLLSASYGNDKCENIKGMQYAVPLDLYLRIYDDGRMICVDKSGSNPSLSVVNDSQDYGQIEDYQPNPEKIMTKASDDDVCSNIEGTQTSAPSGYFIPTDGAQTSSGCYSEADQCHNINGIQTTIPTNMTMTQSVFGTRFCHFK